VLCNRVRAARLGDDASPLWGLSAARQRVPRACALVVLHMSHGDVANGPHEAGNRPSATPIAEVDGPCQYSRRGLPDLCRRTRACALG